MTEEPVDAVITWVDGKDKAHAEKLARFIAMSTVDHPEATAPTRFNQLDEINLCVHSLLRFAPWLRTIYIVTDAQTPPIIKQLIGTDYEDKVKLVDHRDIFVGFEQYLPTFNSLSIETLLWRIPGLSNNFIYLNDDCSIIRPVSYQDFFREDKIVLRGHWRLQSAKKWQNYARVLLGFILKKTANQVPSNIHRVVQENTANYAGYHKYFFQLPHIPFPLKKSIFEDFFMKNPHELSRNINYAFRSHEQFWAISLVYYLALQQNDAVIDNTLEGVTVNGAYHRFGKIKRRLAQADRKKNIAFVCMQSIDAAPATTQKKMFDWLSRRIL